MLKQDKYKKNSSIDLTIIIPFYNSKDELKNLINFYLNLIKYRNIEIIFIDDGSKDKGFFFLKKKFHKITNIKIIKNINNRGPGIARNKGIRLAKGNKLLFLDCGDKLFIKNLLLLIKKYKHLSNNVIFNKVRNTTRHNNFHTISEKDNYYLRLKKFFVESIDLEALFILYNKNFLIKNKIFFKTGIYEDIYFMFLFYVKNKLVIKKFNKSVYHKIYSPNAITSTFSKRHLNDFISSLTNIYKYLKKNKNLYTRLNKSFQYRLRGEYVNLYQKIQKNKFSKYDKIDYNNTLNKKLLPIINLKLAKLSNSKKDVMLKKIIHN